MSNSFSIALVGVAEPFLSEFVNFSAEMGIDITVLSGVDGLKAFDVTIVEVTGGEPFAQGIKQISSSSIIALGNNLSYEETLALLELGVTDFMTKPYSTAELYEALVRQGETSQEDAKHFSSYSSQHSYSTKEISSAVMTSPLLEYLTSLGEITPEYRQKIELAWHEALANALEHGNLELQSAWKNDLDLEGKDRFSKIKTARLNDPRYAERKLAVTVTYKNGELSFTIKDSGGGFTLAEKIPLYKQEEPFGRGITLMNAVMDEVLYENGGTQLTLKKRI